jgi:hypothetical protein
MLRSLRFWGLQATTSGGKKIGKVEKTRKLTFPILEQWGKYFSN